MSWWSIVVQMPRQGIQEAVARGQYLCSYDGGIHGDQAKKMARKVGRAYISEGGHGQPRLVKSRWNLWSGGTR
jgi:hypothetical protein